MGSEMCIRDSNYLDTGRERREAYAYDEAEENLDKVVELAPDYHEGYNQRAFVRFLRENYEGSLPDNESLKSRYACTQTVYLCGVAYGFRHPRSEYCRSRYRGWHSH